MTVEGATDGARGDGGRIDQTSYIDPGPTVHGLKCVHNVLDRHVATRARSERTATETTEAGIDTRGARVDCGQRIGDAEPARVVEMDADRHTGRSTDVDHLLDERRDLGRDSGPDRVGQTDTAYALVDRRSRSGRNVLCIDGSLIRASERSGQGDLDDRLTAIGIGDDGRQVVESFGDACARIATGVLVADRHHELQVVDAGVERPLCAALIENQTPADHAGVAGGLVRRSGELACVGHRRHPVGPDERGQLEIANTGIDQRLEHSQLVGQVDGLLVLQAIAQGDVTHGDRRGKRAHSCSLAPQTAAPTDAW